jgi:hypothetical protein
MSTPQSEEYLQARIESCKLLGLDPDDLSPHEAIRADLLTVLRLWLDNSQTTLLGGGMADAGKLLAVAEALTKFIPEPEHKSRRIDPRETMWKTYQQMRQRGELAQKLAEPSLQARINELQAENAQLRAALGEPVRTGQVKLLPPPAAEPLPSPPAEPPKSKVWTGPNGETWEEPRPNSPVQAKPGWLTKLQADEVNRRSAPPDLFKTSSWDNAGGRSGFDWNSSAVRGGKYWGPI